MLYGRFLLNTITDQRSPPTKVRVKSVLTGFFLWGVGFKVVPLEEVPKDLGLIIRQGEFCGEWFWR